ncbi:MAG: hypothetical protein IJ680_08565 [Paludibacteraceae bacterium]|nr:hypothetical protein [Paludibacteraceae bacterium]
MFEKDTSSMVPEETPEQLFERRMRETKVEGEDEYLDFFQNNPARFYCPDGDVQYFDAFFEALDSAQTKPVKVIHYGDSQIEEDRISNEVRERLQERFGGIGVGWLPVIQKVPTMTFSQVCNASLKRYMPYGSSEFHRSNGRYGPLGQMAVLNQPTSLTFTARQSKGRYTHAQSFTHVKVYYGKVVGGLTINCAGQTQKLGATDSDFEEAVFELADTTHKVSVSLSGQAELYGVQFSGTDGVTLDNAPMRGCSGTIFTSMDSVQLSAYYDREHVRLIILEYGGNMVPGLRSDAAIANYKTSIIRQINHLKKLAPQAAFVFIGPSDMSTRINGSMQTYPKLPAIIAALKEATSETGIAYWDLYEAMGGHNAMVNWVKSSPQLAGGDYVHFTHRGADKVADILCNSLMLYYDYYNARQRRIATIKTEIDSIQNTQQQP